MGFRCPACHEDFGTDRAAWEDHVNHCNYGVEGAAKAMVDMVKGTDITTAESITGAIRGGRTALKVDTYFDITCNICGFSRSTDYEKSFETSMKRIRKCAKEEGWRCIGGETICPECARKRASK